ncbi:MAG: GntR family transcriptional regulator [Asticcacaulis sp.]
MDTSTPAKAKIAPRRRLDGDSNALSALSQDPLDTPFATCCRKGGCTVCWRIASASDILRGVYASGDILPNEIEASATLEISRSAYREAIRILAAKGMVESRPKTGTRVTERLRWNILDPEVLGWMFETEPSETFILNLFELRLITEPTAASLAAQRRNAGHLKTMDQALIVMARETLATEAGRQADLDFHDALMQATGNEALASPQFFHRRGRGMVDALQATRRGPGARSGARPSRRL